MARTPQESEDAALREWTTLYALQQEDAAATGAAGGVWGAMSVLMRLGEQVHTAKGDAQDAQRYSDRAAALETMAITGALQPDADVNTVWDALWDLARGASSGGDVADVITNVVSELALWAEAADFLGAPTYVALRIATLHACAAYVHTVEHGRAELPPPRTPYPPHLEHAARAIFALWNTCLTGSWPRTRLHVYARTAYPCHMRDDSLLRHAQFITQTGSHGDLHAVTRRVLAAVTTDSVPALEAFVGKVTDATPITASVDALQLGGWRMAYLVVATRAARVLAAPALVHALGEVQGSVFFAVLAQFALHHETWWHRALWTVAYGAPVAVCACDAAAWQYVPPRDAAVGRTCTCADCGRGLRDVDATAERSTEPHVVLLRALTAVYTLPETAARALPPLPRDTEDAERWDAMRTVGTRAWLACDATGVQPHALESALDYVVTWGVGSADARARAQAAHAAKDAAATRAALLEACVPRLACDHPAFDAPPRVLASERAEVLCSAVGYAAARGDVRTAHWLWDAAGRATLADVEHIAEAVLPAIDDPTCELADWLVERLPARGPIYRGMRHLDLPRLLMCGVRTAEDAARALRRLMMLRRYWALALDVCLSRSCLDCMLRVWRPHCPHSTRVLERVLMVFLRDATSNNMPYEFIVDGTPYTPLPAGQPRPRLKNALVTAAGVGLAALAFVFEREAAALRATPTWEEDLVQHAFLEATPAVLDWLHAHVRPCTRWFFPCAWHLVTCADGRQSRTIELLEWARAHGVPDAALTLELLRQAVERGMPRVVAWCLRVATAEERERLRLMHRVGVLPELKGCTWYAMFEAADEEAAAAATAATLRDAGVDEADV